MALGLSPRRDGKSVVDEILCLILCQFHRRSAVFAFHDPP